MPWSEWIQSPNVEKRTAIRRHMQYSTHNATGVAFDLLLDDTDYANAQAITGPPGKIHEGTQYRVPDNWDQNDIFPPELIPLTYGVDYALKPGSTFSDPYRYVDYDPDDHAEVLGWTVSSPVVYDRDFHFDLSATLWIDPDTDYPAGTISPLAIGATFATIEETTPAGTVLPAPPDPGPTLSFTVGISPDREAADVSETSTVTAILNGPDHDGWPVATVRPGRWRYWIPGILPLRQYPRNDGLKGGAPSARPTSRQTTTARRTYL